MRNAAVLQFKHTVSRQIFMQKLKESAELEEVADLTNEQLNDIKAHMKNAMCPKNQTPEQIRPKATNERVLKRVKTEPEEPIDPAEAAKEAKKDALEESRKKYDIGKRKIKTAYDRLMKELGEVRVVENRLTEMVPDWGDGALKHLQKKTEEIKTTIETLMTRYISACQMKHQPITDDVILHADAEVSRLNVDTAQFDADVATVDSAYKLYVAKVLAPLKAN